MLRRDTSQHACTVYVTNLSPRLAFCMSSIKILVRHPVVDFLARCMLSSKAPRREGSRNQSLKVIKIMWTCGFACFIHRCVLAQQQGFFFFSFPSSHAHHTYQTCHGPVEST